MKRTIVDLHFVFLNRYTKTGPMAIQTRKNDTNVSGNTETVKDSSRFESYYKDGTFDPALCTKCFAKYGFDVVQYVYDTWPTRTVIELRLLEENEAEDDEKDNNNNNNKD